MRRAAVGVSNEKFVMALACLRRAEAAEEAQGTDGTLERSETGLDTIEDIELRPELAVLAGEAASPRAARLVLN